MNIIANASTVYCVKNIAGPCFRLSYCSHPMLKMLLVSRQVMTVPDNDIGTFLSIKEPLLCPYEQLVIASIGKGLS